MIPEFEEFRIEPSSFGGEIIINWLLPDGLPVNYKVYLFKRSAQDVTQAEIDDYFANINDLSNFNYNGLMVFDNLKPHINKYGDITVINGVQYYYKAVIRDEDTGETNPAASGNAAPTPVLKIAVTDGKDIVEKATKKMLDNVYNHAGKKVAIGRDIEISKHFAIDPISDNYIMLERINGSNNYNFWGQQFNLMRGAKVFGDYDVDVIRSTFITQSSPERRDVIANIYRAQKQFLILAVKKYGAQDCKITIEGDYYNPQIHGVNAVGFTVIFSLLIATKMLIPKDELIHIFGDLRVDYKEANKQ